VTVTVRTGTAAIGIETAGTGIATAVTGVIVTEIGTVIVSAIEAAEAREARVRVGRLDGST
jgi:hypothetical protein